MSIYCHDQAYCHFSKDLINNLENIGTRRKTEIKCYLGFVCAMALYIRKENENMYLIFIINKK